MRHVDMRKLPAAAQEERRRQVIGLRQRGMTYQEIAELVGLSPTGVLNICHRFAAEGAKGLVSKPRGRKPGEQRLLNPAQEAEIEALIRRHTPDELGLPFALWSRAAVRALIARHCGVELAVRTVGKYLARWGFTAQKPIRRAYEQDPVAVRRWLRQDYPEIVRRAKQVRGIVVWGDETGLRADDVRGRSYAPRGRTPVVRVCRTRIKLSLITAVTSKGKLRWMVVDGAVNAPTFLRFLERLIREARGKVFLIVDRLKAHRARLVRDWLEAHRSEIEVHYLPSYSPEPLGQCPKAGRGCQRGPEAGAPTPGAGAQQGAAEASRGPAYAQPVQASAANPRHLSAPAVPLCRMIKTMRAGSIWWLFSGSRVMAARHTTRAATRAPSRALPRRRALCTNAKKAR
jgi:transposase